MAFTPNQIAAYAYKAGFRGQALRWAVAIAMAESGGNPLAYNPETAAKTKPGAGSYGLWQIYSTAHPEFSREQLKDPLYNAQAAYKVYREAGAKFSPWTTYTKGIATSILEGLGNLKIDSIPSVPKPKKKKMPAPASQPEQIPSSEPPSRSSMTVPEIIELVKAIKGEEAGIDKKSPIEKFVGVSLASIIFVIFGIVLILIGTIIIFSPGDGSTPSASPL